MAKQAAAPDIAVQKAAGKPRLEVLEGNPGPGGDPVRPVEPLPPPPQTAAPLFGADGAPAPERRPWTADEAALAGSGAHNAGWTAGLVLRKEPKLLPAAYADPKELHPYAPALARLLDQTPLEPGGAGPLGILGDVLVAAQGIVALEVRHAELVSQARKRLAREEAAAPARSQPAPAPSPYQPPTAPPLTVDELEEDGGDFRFQGAALRVLAMSGGNPLGEGESGGAPFR